MLRIDHLTLTHRKDRHQILQDFSFVLNRGDKAVLIGEEGNGKSTLLKWIFDPALVDGYMEAEGTCSTQGELLAYLPQELPEPDRLKTVGEYFRGLDAFQTADPRDLHRIAGELKLEEGFFDSAQRMDRLSGGERVKIQMAGILLGRPEILLLDEPSNDIDIRTLEWLEALIRGFRGGILFISHDETLIENTANRVILLEQLRRKTVPRVTVANVPFRQFTEERRSAFVRQEIAAKSERREEKKAMERFRRIEQKVRQDQASVSRQDPHSGRLLKKKMKAVKSLERRYEKEHAELTEFPEEESAITIRFDRQKRLPSGKIVLDYHAEELRSPSGALLAKGLDLTVKGPEKLCVIGANGIGKTTWIRAVAEQFLAREDVDACYMPQDYEEQLPFDISPVEYLAPSGQKSEMTAVRTYLGAMKYTADEMFHPIRELSGGQKAKLLLLRMSLSEADVLILDEPTRNFSPLSAPEVRRILREFPGAVISISHDRKFIREVCGSVYELTREGFVRKEIGAEKEIV